MSKKCAVCILFTKKNYDNETVNYINRLIKLKTDKETINDQLALEGDNRLSDYFFKIHNNDCLKNFNLPKTHISNTNHIISKDTPNLDEINGFNIIEELEKYRNMSFQEKEEEDKINRLKEIEFVSSIIIHNQLIYGRNLKATVPKEDISALKQIEDILKNIDEINDKKPKVPPVIVTSFLDKERKVSQIMVMGEKQNVDEYLKNNVLK